MIWTSVTWGRFRCQTSRRMYTVYPQRIIIYILVYLDFNLRLFWRRKFCRKQRVYSVFIFRIILWDYKTLNSYHKPQSLQLKSLAEQFSRRFLARQELQLRERASCKIYQPFILISSSWSNVSANLRSWWSKQEIKNKESVGTKVLNNFTGSLNVWK